MFIVNSIVWYNRWGEGWGSFHFFTVFLPFVLWKVSRFERNSWFSFCLVLFCSHFVPLLHKNCFLVLNYASFIFQKNFKIWTYKVHAYVQENNNFDIILKLFHVLPNFPLTTNETMRDYYFKHAIYELPNDLRLGKYQEIVYTL